MSSKKTIFTLFFFLILISVVFSQQNKIYNTLSGTVLAGTNPLPKGNMYVLKNSRSNFLSVQSTEIINGNFQVKDIISGSYILYVIPELDYDFLYFPKYIPTYFGKTYSWEDALRNDINKNNLNIEFNLLSYKFPFYGNKKISGRLTFGRDFNSIEYLPVVVILLNESGEPMDFRIANELTGEFTFENLPEGVYFIHPEMPGFKTTNIKIEIKEEKNSYENINFFVDNQNIKVDKQSEKIISFNSNHFLNVFLKENVNYPIVCELISLSGQSVSKKIFYSDEIKLNTSGLVANMYILKIKTYDNSPIKTAKVFIRNY